MSSKSLKKNKRSVSVVEQKKGSASVGKNRSHRLLNQFIDSTKPATKKPNLQKEIEQEKLGLDQLLAQLEKEQAAAAPRLLGDLGKILGRNKAGKNSSLDQEIKKKSYQEEFFNQKNKSLKQEIDFPTKQVADDTNPNPLKNLSFIVFALFGLGLAVFGLNQLIKNASLNFAAPEQSSLAQTPKSILTFQGRLSHKTNGVFNQPVKMLFELYNTSGGNTPPPIGGDLLWSSNFCSISPNQQGVFAVNLGSGNGDGNDGENCGLDLGSVFAQNSSVWLQITVDKEVLFPRQLVKSVPYALNSASLQGFSASKAITANTIPVVDESGNLNFVTQETAITNLGNLGLISKTGDLFLLPGSGKVYIGNQDYKADLKVSGDLEINNSLIFSATNEAKIQATNAGLSFYTKAGQDFWENQLTLTKNGFLGLGTDQPKQKLTINQGSLNFDFSVGPDSSQLRLQEQGYHPQGLTRLPSPPTLKVSLIDSPGNLSNARYKYRYSYITADGKEGGLSPIFVFDSNLDQKQFSIENISTYQLPNVTGRKIYRTKANGEDFYFLATINDNHTTSWTDNTADEALISLLVDHGNQTGTYKYKLTFITDKGEETNSSINHAAITLTGDQRAIKIDNLPIATVPIRARRLYRSLANSDFYFLVANIPDNNTTSWLDTLADKDLVALPTMPSGGGIYANNRLSLQLDNDGSIITQTKLTAQNRLETSHGNNQGLQIPTSSGKPSIKVGQKVGDIVYDSLNQLIYIYNGVDFVSTGGGTPSFASNSHCAGNTCRLVLDPEYPGVVITGSADLSQSDLSSGHDVVDNQYRFNYYRWVSANSQTPSSLTFSINLTIPQDFSSWQEKAITLDFLTHSSNLEQNSLSLEVFRQGSSLSVTKTKQTSPSESWASTALNTQPLTLSRDELEVLGVKGGETLTLKIIGESQNNHYIKIGQLNLNYYSSGEDQKVQSQSLWRQLSGVIFPANQGQDVVLGGDSTASAKIAFLNLGDVGVPTLYLQGNIFLDNQSKKNYLDLAQDSSFRIRTLDQDKALERFTILPNGNVGIGVSDPQATLDVGGDTRIKGSLHLQPVTEVQAGPCNLENQGKIYYNSLDLKFYACQAVTTDGTGSAWVKLGQ